MKLLEFLPIVSKSMQCRFYGCAFGLLRFNSLRDITSDSYLIFYQKSDESCAYTLAYDIRIAFGYVAAYGDNCQVMLLNAVDNKPNVEQLY